MRNSCSSFSRRAELFRILLQVQVGEHGLNGVGATGTGWTSPLVFFENIFYFVVWLKQRQKLSHLERGHVLDEIAMMDS